MRIGIDISQIVYGTGVSNYTRLLVENLVKVDRKNQYVLFGASLRQFAKLRQFKEEVADYPNVEFKLLRLPLALLNFLWNRLHVFPIERFIGEVDVFHSSDWVQPPVKSSVTKKVTTVHDLIVYLFPSSLHPKIVSTQKRRLALVKKEADSIIADSQTTKEDLVKFLEIPQEKITVVYLAPSPEFKPKDDDKIAQVLEKYKIKKPYILSVATQEPRKNIQTLLDAFGEITKTRTNVILVLTGKYGWGPGLRVSGNIRRPQSATASVRLKSQSDSGGDFGGQVIWTGYVSQDDLITLYSGCRVFVYPSLYEGFGLPILEAMAAGSPVVTSNNSSMVEVAKDVAILVDPRSQGQIKKAIELVLDLNLENYQKMVRASLDRARQFSSTKTARETLKVYEELVRNNENPQVSTQTTPGVK